MKTTILDRAQKKMEFVRDVANRDRVQLDTMELYRRKPMIMPANMPTTTQAANSPLINSFGAVLGSIVIFSPPFIVLICINPIIYVNLHTE
jgi:hypothetical protein